MHRQAESATALSSHSAKIKVLDEHIIEIVSDSGEGAQKAGQSFGAISAKMGNGVWTVEIIPAEIQPPARTREGASGIRIRVGSGPVTNPGNKANLVVAFNEQVPYGRIHQDAYKKGTIMLIENKWATHDSEEIRELYKEALRDFRERGFVIHEIPMEEECLKLVRNPRKGKNMWVLGMLCYLYNRSLSRAEAQIRNIFAKKSDEVIESNLKLLHAGYDWSRDHFNFRFDIPVRQEEGELVVMNGNAALALGVMAAGIEVCSMYPITPATSASHVLAEAIERVGGVVHQAEDEIAAIGFAIGASYAGKTAVTITSGPGIALKTEFIGLAIMAEIPLVIIDVQRGGPSTGLPTKVEQSDLLAVLYGQPGDSPKIVLAPSTIEECFHFVILARKLAESFRLPVFVLSDANLATGVQPFPRPEVRRDWFSPPIDQSPWKNGSLPYDWDPKTGLSKRPVPGQKGGEYTLTGLAHTRDGKVSYTPETNQDAASMRSRKIAAFGHSLKPPKVYGDNAGDLLLVGWGSTRGAIEEAVDRARSFGANVSAVHLRFLSPIEPGLKEIFSRFDKVMTVEINYSDEVDDTLITSENRRVAQLATVLRTQTMMEVDCFSSVHGHPLHPRDIVDRILEECQIKEPLNAE